MKFLKSSKVNALKKNKELLFMHFNKFFKQKTNCKLINFMILTNK